MLQSIRIFGEVLFDYFPDGSRVLGGAPFNVAWHMQAFGLQPSLISRVGNDAAGGEIRRAMLAWGMDDSGLQNDHQHPTGGVAITLQAGEPSYEILAQQAYDFIDAHQLPETEADWLYHGSLALRDAASRRAYQALLSRHRGKVFMDVNLRAPWWQLAEVETWLRRADWVKLNEEELRQLQAPQSDATSEMQRFAERFRLQGLIVTRGEQGASCLLADGQVLEIAPQEQMPVVDCVGAGDAFAAVLLLGLARNWPIPQTMRRAQDFASALVGQRGATVSDGNFYRRLVAEWLLDTR